MDFNFNFKNAVQLRSYNQLKSAEKKLKKKLEQKLAALSEKFEKMSQNRLQAMSQEEKDDPTRTDRAISDTTEDFRHDLGLVLEEHEKLHEALVGIQYPIF